jgi:autophagy-related protein 16
MNETLREKEEHSRIDAENHRKAREEIAILRKKVEQHAELMAEKDRTVQVCSFKYILEIRISSDSIVQILHDEISTALLELGQVEDRNQNLAKDNAKLLQRWLDAKQAEANRVNEANEFYETMRSRRDTVLSWRDDSETPDGTANRPTSRSGKGSGSPLGQVAATKNGPVSPAARKVDQTPNG